MSKLITITLAIGALSLGACAHTDRTANKAEYDAAKSHAERDYHYAKEKCGDYSGNAG